ncbi:MAG: helix-hairpin-helix domain-containing protein [Sediminibacterium sp.]
MRIRRIIQRHLTFSHSERLVVIYLCVIIIVMAVSQKYWVNLFSRNAQSEFEKEHLALRNKVLQNIHTAGLSEKTVELVDEKHFDLFYFNPNTISQSDWVKLGISEKTAATIINYLSKGGQFNRKTDLLRIYGFTEADFNRIYPYITFEKSASNKTSAEKQILLYPFNPNTISADEWINFGVQSDVAGRIINYLNKGGSFKSPDDLRKIYAFDEEYLPTLAPFMFFDNVPAPLAAGKENNTGNQLTTTEMNLLTYSDLVYLGFSENVAKNFINYRNKLGGYFSKNQVYSVYGMDRNMAANVFSEFTIDTTLVKKLSINSATEDELKNHPYISDELAMQIVSYRNATGKYYSIYEIQKAGYISKKSFENLLHYLKL